MEKRWKSSPDELDHFVKKSVVLSWSGGKDSALALDALSRDPEVEVVGLLAFGDLFLEDVRAYREGLLEGSGFEPMFPMTADPCGERGEFHTFVSDGPPFATPIPYRVGEAILRDERFMFCDIERQ